MDMGSIAAAVNSLKVAGDIAVSLVNLKTMAEVQAKAIELNQKIITAQHDIFAANAAQSALIQRVSELEKEIASVKAWEAQKQRYQLAIPFAGITVYALKKSMSDGEPSHYICANCYHNGKRAMIQHVRDKDGWILITCSACKAAGHTRYRGIGPDQYAEDVKTTS